MDKIEVTPGEPHPSQIAIAATVHTGHHLEGASSNIRIRDECVAGVVSGLRLPFNGIVRYVSATVRPSAGSRSMSFLLWASPRDSDWALTGLAGARCDGMACT